MVAVQTTYTPRIAAGLEGDTASMFESDAVSTRVCETAAGIGFGRAVSEGANAFGAVLGGATRFIGVSLRDVTLVVQQGGTVDVYAQRQNMGVREAGDVWVRPVTAVVHGTPATYDGTTGQLQPAAAGIAITGSRWMTSALANELAILRLTRPGAGA